VFRIGHLGDLNELMLLGALGGVEMALADAGVAVTAGSGVAAAEEYWRSTAGQRISGDKAPQPAAVGASTRG
jgi:hypothetical protein